MSIRLLTAELSRFLRSTDPEVLCVTGKWGVGKTYAWNHYLREAQAAGRVGLEKYAYVSLFGRNSLEDVRTAIVENTVNAKGGSKPDLSNLNSLVKEFRRLTGPFARLVSFVPNAAGYVGSLNRALFLMVRNQIICIDDLERVGSGLTAMNVLGLVSSLKEEKACKVVVLLNDEALSGENATTFTAQIEKVADIIMVFEPTSEEAAEIGVDGSTKFSQWLREDTIKLGIVNIRVIKKIETLCRRVHEILPDHDDRILKQAVDTIALVAYARFQPDRAPSIKIIRRYNRYMDLLNKNIEKSKGIIEEENEVHKDFLRDYGFHHLDEFDIHLVDGVERGYFDENGVLKRADALEKKLKFGDHSAAFSQVWRRFHDSFDDDEDAVVDEMVRFANSNVTEISPINLSATISFLKEFGRHKEATELLESYVVNRNENPGFWNLDNNPFSGHVTDPDVRAAFETRYAEIAPLPDPREILKRIGNQGGWNPEDIASLVKLDVGNVIAILKGLRGDALRSAVKGGLTFRNISSADERLPSIGRTFEVALRRIGEESRINAKRVGNFGVQVEDASQRAVPLPN